MDTVDAAQRSEALTKQLAEATLFTAQRTSAVTRAFALFRIS